MDINISSVHFKADVKLEDFIKDRVGRLSSVYEGVIGGKVVLKLDNNESDDKKITEIMLLIRGKELFAKKQSKSFEEATDNAVEALRKQLLKHKQKERTKN